MRFAAGLCFGVAAALAAPAVANDTMATLSAGGLQFITSDKVAMVAEDLTVSPDRVTVVYRFKNNSASDEHALIAARALQREIGTQQHVERRLDARRIAFGQPRRHPPAQLPHEAVRRVAAIEPDARVIPPRPYRKTYRRPAQNW